MSGVGVALRVEGVPGASPGEASTRKAHVLAGVAGGQGDLLKITG